MKFAIFTHVSHVKEDNQYYAYAPYVKEMNIWGKNVNELIIVAPFLGDKTAIDTFYEHQNIEFIPVPSFDVLSIKSIFFTILKLPGLIKTLFKAMRSADHIHLRCPGNIGLLGCFIQILFPNTPKTAKYAGNWDPKSKQPLTYKLQQWILNNTFLTRNIQVLVYGEWEGMTQNIKPFFTASYTVKDIVPIAQKSLNGIVDFIFVGALVKGKHPLYAIQLVENLYQKGYIVRLNLYGDGVERKLLEDYIAVQQLQSIVSLQGNQTQDVVQKAYENSHFVVLPSDSEGWPKVIAEGMFWGCVPIATAISCVPYMLDYGNRGILLEMNLENDSAQIAVALYNQTDFDSKRNKAAEWSRKFTLDVFEDAIQELIV
ncbi:MAG: glycosyltransferase [Flavobacterium sp.]|uniref:glycosyltransferase n=1 Tax=Flavobacterium sp. TaxID=239 RepID=UPI002733A8F4|nr:glycosyltransferase [Flavobacterium sp.]MDP3679671.1 glycosyltransferase [Flavobacterium sp.]MDZ4329335.1 glycosyltransferase [Flavobacterium sp.]